MVIGYAMNRCKLHNKSCGGTRVEHNITQRRGFSNYDSEMLGFKLSLDLNAQLFEHLIVIFGGPMKRELYIEYCYGTM